MEKKFQAALGTAHIFHNSKHMIFSSHDCLTYVPQVSPYTQPIQLYNIYKITDCMDINVTIFISLE